MKEGKRIFTFFRCTEGISYCLAEWFMVKIVGAWCAREDVESHKGNL